MVGMKGRLIGGWLVTLAFVAASSPLWAQTNFDRPGGDYLSVPVPSGCVSGVRGAGVVEPKSATLETSIDRPGGDYRGFEVKSGEGEESCQAACTADNKCRAWTYARAGYIGKEGHCFLKREIKPPRRKAGFTSGVVR